MKKLLFISLFLLILIPNTVLASSYTITIMILGDSLSTSYGMPTKTGWVNLLEQRLQVRSPTYQVINASITGETTFGGRSRITQLLEAHRPDFILLELGGNDGLQGLSIKSITANLQTIIQACKQHDATILLLGMQIPPNYGITYAQKFQDIYPQLAKNYQLELVPFLLAGFAEKRDFFQPDGIHPNIQAQKMILDNIWKVFYPMLDSKNHL